MNINFDLQAHSVEFVFGSLASPLQSALKKLYTNEGLAPADHWVMWVFDDGLAVPVPTSINESVLPIQRILQITRTAMMGTYTADCSFTSRLAMEKAICSIEDVLAPRMAYAA